MKIYGTYDTYTINSDSGATGKKNISEKEYSNYLTQKYGCLIPGKNVSISVTGGLLRKAMADDKMGAWLERELAKAPDYIKEAQQSAKMRGSTLKFCSIEFGEEYSTMCTMTVTDGRGTDHDIDEWLERIKEKKEKHKEEQKSKKKQEDSNPDQSTYTTEFRGKDLKDLIGQFDTKLMENSMFFSNGCFDVRG